MGSVNHKQDEMVDEMMALEISRVGITIPIDDLAKQVDRHEWHWDHRPAKSVIEYHASHSIDAARQCFRAWAEKSAELERLLADGKAHMDTAAQRLKDAALLPDREA